MPFYTSFLCDSRLARAAQAGSSSGQHIAESASVAPSALAGGAADAAAARAFFAGGGAAYGAGWGALGGPAAAGLPALLGDSPAELYAERWAPLAAFLTNASLGGNGTGGIEEATERLLRAAVKGALAAAAAAGGCGAASGKPFLAWAAPLWGPLGLPRVGLAVGGGEERAVACVAAAAAGAPFRAALLAGVEAALGLDKGKRVGLFAFFSATLAIAVGSAAGAAICCAGCCGYTLCKFPCQASTGKVGAE